MRKIAVPFHTIETRTLTNGIAIEGYASVFNHVYEVNSLLEGNFDEVMARGSFVRALARTTPAAIRMQFDHGHDSAIGALPIGVFHDIREDAHGLAVRGTIHDTWLTEPVRGAIESGAVAGMSFRFTVAEDVWTDPRARPRQLRTILHVERLFEAGPVVWPANPATSVALATTA